jgi:hypothetical protein
MSDLPTSTGFQQNQGPAVCESGPVVEMKRHDGYVAKHLDPEFPRPDIHVRSFLSARPDLLEDLPEVLFKFDTPVCAVGHVPGVEDRGVIGERISKRLPIQIFEGSDEIREEGTDFRLRSLIHGCL